MGSNEKVRIGLIGAGRIAQIVHIPLWKKVLGANLVALCDKVAPKAQWVAEKYDVPQYFSSFEDMLKSPEIDAIDICTETDTHKDLTIEALSAGKHVLVEKPMATSYADAKAMVDAAEKYGKGLMVANNVRFRRDAITLKAFVDGGDLGDIFYAQSGWFLKKNLSRVGKDWIFDKKRSGGGVIMDLGSQMLDVSWWLLGNIKPVAVKTVTSNLVSAADVEDTATSLIHFANGSSLTLEVSWAILAERNSLYTRLYGTEGTAHINPLRVYKNMHGNLINIVPTKEENDTVRYKRSYKNELKHFADCIGKNMPLQAGGAEVCERLKILEAMYLSARTGREVELT